MPATGFSAELTCGAAQALIGLGSGMLLVTVGLALYTDWKKAPGPDRAIHTLGWTSGVVLLLAAALLWFGGRGPCAPALHLAVMAAFVAPPLGPQEHAHRWRDLTRTLLAAFAAGSAYAIALGWIPAGRTWSDAAPLVQLGSVIFGGLAARLLSEAVSALVNAVPVGRLFDVLYACGTLIVGANALHNLAQEGVAWNVPLGADGLVSVWLAWSAAWVSPRGQHRLRAALVAGAVLLFIAMTLVAGPAGIGLLTGRAP